MPVAETLTERQQKWFASVHEGVERETGRSLLSLISLSSPDTPAQWPSWLQAAWERL